MRKRRIVLKKVGWPEIERPRIRPEIPDTVFEERLAALRGRIEERGFDCIAIYGDREHYSNFKHYAGFEPRFEEGLLVIFRDPAKGDAALLGNECFSMHETTARIPLRGVLTQAFSLPSQPLDKFTSMEACLREAGICAGMKVGLAGWKLFSDDHGADPKQMYCVSAYIVDALREIVSADGLQNVTDWLVHPGYGLRVINGVHEAAYFEYGAALASDGVANVLKNIRPGMLECEAAQHLQAFGLQETCHPMCSAGKNAHSGLVSPSFYEVQQGDAFTTSFGLEGGLSCRAGYLVKDRAELAQELQGFEEDFAKPYYEAVVAWYEAIGIGVTGGEMYALVQGLIPKERYGWVLNPGHLCATEEWLSSPIYEDSDIPVRSGMLIQMDIIPGMKPYVSANTEDGVLIADEALRSEIERVYPQLWSRIIRRREFMEKELGICLKSEVLPLSNLAARYSPYVLDGERAFCVE